MTKILICSDSPTLSTGYGHVIRQLLPVFNQQGYEIKMIGRGYLGEEHDYNFKIYKAPKGDYFGQTIFHDVMQLYEPDILFTLGDPWMFEWIKDYPIIKNTYWIQYFPIDGKPIPPSWHNLIATADKPIVISKFAQNAVKEILPNIDVKLLYHGVDRNIFYPKGKQKLKKQYGLENTFVISCVARNQQRKNIPVLIKAFSKFSQIHNNIFLYLRMSNEEKQGWNIQQLLERFKITDKAFVIDADNRNGINIDKLADLYSLSDLFVLPTKGEGFGLPLLEAQSCGCPILATNCSNIPELTHSNLQRINVLEQMIQNRNIEQAYADPEDLKNKLLNFYNLWETNSEEYKNLQQKGIELSKNMTWDIIRKNFKEIINECITESDFKKNEKMNLTCYVI